MEKNAIHSRRQSKRQPLCDASNRANIAKSFKSEARLETLPLDKQMKSSSLLGSLNEVSSLTTAENKRVSAVIDYHTDSKRNSAISTTSTGSGRRKTHIGPWRLERTLGKGSTGRVRLAKHSVTGQSAAIKIVSKKSAALSQSQSIAAMDKNIGTAPGSRTIPSGIEREVVIMKLIEHPNVISLLDVWENRGELYLVLEYVEGGELFDYVSESGPLPEVEAVRLFRQIIAALSYCHQYNICHRDLKPENILLDSQRNIKVADFGMAALQPMGHWLNTSCGSPHYASPEIIYGHRYQGNKADIWSCGIILFAMLAGFLPFDGGDLGSTLKLVKKGEYILPPWFSREAVDMIQRILQKKPENRISMNEMWQHPLLKKYETHPILADYPLNAIGPPSPLSSKDFRKMVSHRRDIDMEILRSLQTLWHGKRKDELMEMLLNDEANHEKLFYKALLKFREEQLENYEGPPLEYSSSDYHHISRPLFRPHKRISGNYSESSVWKRSRFSIATNTSSLRENSGKGPLSVRTIASYDPYRSSQTAITEPKVEYANVVIHRHPSSGFSAGVPLDMLNVGTQPVGERGSSLILSSSNAAPWSSSRRSSIASFQSRSSMGSLRQRRASTRGYKRNVSFRHLQNMKTANQSADTTKSYAEYSLPPEKRRPQRRQSERAKRLSTDRFSSPSLPSPPACVQRASTKEGEIQVEVKPRQSYQYWKEEARKVSQELEQICEEAFNSSSISSSQTIDAGFKYPESPVTSVSTPGNLGRYYDKKNKRSSREQDFESCSSYATKELVETRRRLIEHSSQANADNLPSYLSEVIAHLDRLIGGELALSAATNSTLVKEPTRLSQNFDNKLPPISEERPPVRDFLSSESNFGRSISKTVPLRPDDWERKKTIRVVPDSTNNLGTIKPLTIRKKRTTLEFRTSASDSRDSESQRSASESVPPDRAAVRRSTAARFFSGLEPIEENPKSPKKSEARNPAESRKWSWFKHTKSASYADVGPPTPPKDNLASGRSSLSNIADASSHSIERLNTVEKHPEIKRVFPSGPAETGKKLLKLFGRKKHEKSIHEIGRGINDPDFSFTSLASVIDSGGSDSNEHTIPSRERKAERSVSPPPSQNWFMKFFHIKPASRVIALSLSKSRARKEILKIIREWRKYGIEDIYYDRPNGVIRGRVGELNLLRLRPVDFSAKLFTVLEFGRQADLSLIRFKQERGAASSFRKVVDTLTTVLKQRNLLVEDAVKAKKMAKLLEFAPQ
ncbi:serine/threonine-protein kinase gin4 [Ophidiomyces ophidiicola]|nr:serine/threonine-protein kinase gin4 [Ophidiomyces ophidiicola]KAI1984192.1 serine/threonine-protein kinase gin4 [Ophidiomyces ophidiicola]